MRRCRSSARWRDERHRPVLRTGFLAAADQGCHVVLGRSSPGSVHARVVGRRGEVAELGVGPASAGVGAPPRPRSPRPAPRARHSPDFAGEPASVRNPLSVPRTEGMRGIDVRSSSGITERTSSVTSWRIRVTSCQAGAQLPGKLRQAFRTHHDQDDDEDHEDLRRVEAAHDGSVYKSDSPPTRSDVGVPG